MTALEIGGFHLEKDWSLHSFSFYRVLPSVKLPLTDLFYIFIIYFL